MKIVCLVGPPGAGKTSLAEYLSAWGVVFRLRKEVAAHHLIDDKGAAKAWLDLPSVQEAFNNAVAREESAGTKLLICDNFPGDGEQVNLLGAIADKHEVAIVHLVLSEEVISERLARRRVCSQCDEDPLGDPRSPATSLDNDLTRCGRCGSPLARRPNDEDGKLQERIARYCRNMIGIAEMCRRNRLVLHELDAVRPTVDIGQFILTRLID